MPKPRRKYEVDESSWFVIKGRAVLRSFDTDGRAHLRAFKSRGRASVRWVSARTYSLGGRSLRRAKGGARSARGWFATHRPVFAARVRFNLRRAGLAFSWRRVPEAWELAFIDRMKGAEHMGIPFVEVLRNTLPGIMGVDGTRVLGYWTGRRSMLEPEAFVRETAKMFGRSSRQVVMGVFDGLDEARILADRAPEEPKYQSLVDAIRRADERKTMTEEMRERRVTAIVPVEGPESS